jgi:large repetitive protein
VPLFFFKKETDTLDEVGRMVSRSFHPDSSKKGMQSYLHSIRRFALKAISSLFLIPLLFSCSPRISSNFPGASSVTSISTELKGTIFPLVDSLFSDYDASSSLPSFIRSAFSSTCDYRDVTVAIYKLDEAGNTDATPVASVSLLDEKANYRFEDAKSLGIDPSPSAKLEYILKVSGCGDTEIRAPITGLGAFDVTAGVALMGLLSQGTAEQKALLREKTPEELSALMTALSSRLSKNATIAQAFTELAADPELKSQFEASFGHSLSVSDLQNVEPHAMSLTWPKNPVPEGRTSSFFVAASHWNPNYTIRYLWKLDGVIVSHAAVFNYTPEKNHQGTHVLSLYMGADNGSGAINTTTPYFYQSESFTVENTFPPTAPAFQFSGAGILTASTQNQFNVQTGTNRVNCATFSSFAITENTNAPPSDLDFDFTCDSAGTQAITYDFLNTSDGPKTLRLWTRDSIGTLSATPSTFTVFLDRTAPTTSIGSGPSGITNATSGTFSFSGVDPGGGAIAGYECKLDSGSYQACSSPFTTPTLSAGSHTFLVRATDTLGNVSSLASRTWTIDLTAPTLSLDSQPSSLNANTSATFTFSAVDTGGGTVSGYQCKLNSGSFTSCTSPYTITGLPSGAQSVSIKAFDSAGNSSSVSTTSWTIDRTGPNVSILSSPPSVTYLGSGSFSFTGTDSGGSSVGGYECKIDSSAYSACTSPKSFASLSDGNHQFSVRATDQLGNTGAATNYSWNVDSSSSLATISVHPANISNVTSPSFSFDASSSSGVAAFECKLDSASFTACTSPQSYTGLTEGSHTFSVRPIDASANAGVAVSFSWTLDTTAPIATISSGPNAVVNSTAGSLSFSGTDSGGATISSYECKLDSASYTSCSSPLSFSALSVGSHTYSIRAVDSAGNTGTAATRSWTIDQTAPTLSLTSSPVALTNATSATFQFSATDAGGSTVAGFECALDGGAYSACSSPAALTSLGAGAHSYAIRASDAVGNTSGSTTHSWTIDLSAPAVTLGTKPNAFTNSSSAAFTFTGSDTGGGTVSSFECKIDSGNFSACTSPQTLTGLSSAAHTYSVRAIDSAGNTGSPTSHTWTIDTTAPSATIVTGPSSLTNSTSATFTFSATDAGGGSIDSFECKVDSESFSTCTSPKNYTGIVDGAHTFSVRAIDTAGNTGTAATQTWTVDATAPGAPSVVFQLNSASSLISNTQSLNLTVASCTDRSHVLVSEDNTGPTPGDSRWLNCSTTAGAISKTLISTTEGAHTLRVWARDLAGNVSATSSSLSLIYDPSPPVMTGLSINNGQTTTNNKNVLLDINATSTTTGIDAFCVKYNDSSAPLKTDSCFVTLTSISESITNSLALNDYPFSLGAVIGDYAIRVWLRDEIGNVSTQNDVADTDLDSIAFTPDPPPTLSNVIASSTDTPQNPLSSADTTVAFGSDVYVRWKVTDNQAIPNGNVSIYYTTNESTYTLVTTGLNNSVNGDCTLDSESTGCYKWTASSPLSTYYKIEVRVNDSGISTVNGTSNPLNNGSMNILTGNVSLGLGGSATKSILIGQGEDNYNDSPDTQAVAVTKTGIVFFKYKSVGLVYVSPTDGLIRILIPQTGTTSGNGGGASSATLRDLTTIMLDHAGDLLIWDHSQIRKINLSTANWRIDQLIGGGADTSSGSVATSYNLGLKGTNYSITPTPNGRIYFQKGRDVWYYEPSNQTVVKLYTLSGLGSHNMTGVAANYNNGTCPVATHGIAFNKTNSELVKIIRRQGRNTNPECGNLAQSSDMEYTSNFNLSTGLAEAPHPTGLGWSSSFFTGLNGKIYVLPQGRARLQEYNPSTNTFTNVLGNGSIGRCADGTAALSCPMTVMSAFVNEFGKIFFLDMGVIRTVDTDGNVQTLAGQPRNFGIGSNPISARYSMIAFFSATPDHLFVMNKLENQLVKMPFAGGNLEHIAGTGAPGTPANGSVATTSPLPNCGWAMPCGFIVHPTLQRLYHMGSSDFSSYIDLTTGLWVREPNVLQSSARVSYLGLSDERLIAILVTHAFPNGLVTMRTIDPITNARTHVLGRSTNNPTTANALCVDTLGTDCILDNIQGTGLQTQTKYDSVTDSWLIVYKGTRDVRLLPHDGGTVTAFETTAQPIQSFDFRRVGADQFLYYCANNGNLYKRNVVTNVETVLTLPSSAIKCAGHSLHYHAGRDSLMFIFIQNGLYGVAEYQNP